MRAQVAGDVRDEETAAARDGGARERLDDVSLPVATRRPFTRKPSLASLRTSAQKVVCFDANDGTRRRSGGGRTAARASDARGSARVRRAGEARRVEILVIWNAHRSTLHTCDVPNPRTRKARRVSCAANHNTARPRLRKAPSTPSKPLPSLLRPWQWRRRFAARPLRWRARAWRAAPAPPPRKSAESRRQEACRSSARTATGDATTTRLEAAVAGPTSLATSTMPSTTTTGISRSVARPRAGPTAAGRPTGGDDSTMTADAEGSAARRWATSGDAARAVATEAGETTEGATTTETGSRYVRTTGARARRRAARDHTAVVSTFNLKPRGCAFLFFFSRV